MSRLGPALFAALTTAALAALPPGCSSQEQLQGEGGQCSQATDCQEGLVCITQADGTRKCSGDLGNIQPPAQPDAGAGDAAAKDGGKGDAAMPPGDGGTPPQDSGTPPQDSGSPPQDSGGPPQDSGSPPQDSGGGTDAATD